MDGEASSPRDEPEAAAGEGQSAEFDDVAFPVPMAVAPVLGLVVAVLFWWAFRGDLVLAALVPFGVWLAVMIVIDLRELRIPNRLVLVGVAVAAPMLAVASFSDWPDVSLVRAVLAALAHGGVYFLLKVAWPRALGGGDVKLAPLLGAHVGLFGWLPVVRSIVFAHVLAGVAAMAILVLGVVSLGRIRWKTYFPLGPFMAAGAIVSLVIEARG